MLNTAPLRALLKRGIRQGLVNVRREGGTIGSIGAMLGVAILLQILVIGRMGTQAIEQILEQRTETVVEFRETASTADIDALFAALKGESFVERVSFVSSEQAYDHARRTDPDLVSFLETYGVKNPFRDSVRITLQSLDAYPTIAAFLGQDRWQQIIDPAFLSGVTAEQEYTGQMLRLIAGLRSIAILIISIVCATIVFIIMELTRTRSLARSEEVLVERLAGAATPMILIPFATEAAVLLFGALIASLAIAVLLVWIAPVLLPVLRSGGVLHEVTATTGQLLVQRLGIIMLLEILAVPLIATVGAWIGIHKQVQNPQIAMA